MMAVITSSDLPSPQTSNLKLQTPNFNLPYLRHLFSRIMRTEARATIKLAIPIIIGELAQMSLHLVDTAMVGALGYRQLAAAALVINTMNIPFVLGIGMTMSVSQMVSMAHGRKNPSAVSHYLFNGFFLCAITAVVISGALIMGRSLLGHMGQDPEVVRLAIPFMSLMGLSIIPMLLFMTLKQFADGLEFTRTAMVLSLLALPVNIFLNWLLIFGNWGFPRLELAGAGWSTFITRSLTFFVLLVVVLRHRTFRPFIPRWKKIERQGDYIDPGQWRLKKKDAARIKGHWHSQFPSGGHGSRRFCSNRHHHRNHICCSPGSAPDRTKLRFLYIYGIHGTGPGWINSCKQCLRPGQLAKDCKDWKKHAGHGFFLRPYVRFAFRFIQERPPLPLQ